MPPPTLLDRILWTQLARVVHGAPPEWEPEAASARAIRSVLADTELDPEEAAIVERWDGNREGSRMLFDRLLQARVNRAVRAGLRVEAERLGLKEAPRVPKVLIVREGAPEEERAGTVAPRGNPKKTVVEFLSSGRTDVANLAPGAKLDELVDLLVLANQEAADELRSSMGATASVVRADAVPEIDLLLATPTPSIQVIDIERELARLEEVLRSAIPPERRPAKSGAWSFGQDLTGELLGGKYRIKALKGKGAFKTVYEGEDEMLGARVAVAVLNPKGARSPMALEHFLDEAKKLTTLDHENIVRWITFDRTAEGLTYFVMEYVEGEELEKLLRREVRLAPKRVAGLLLQVVAALKRAHKGKQGSLLHLDLKPENVFVQPALAPGEPERVKVIDFGIGQHVGAEIRAAERPELRSLYDLPAEDLGKSIGSIALPEEDEPEEAEKTPPAAGSGRRRVQRARGGTLLYASPEQCKHLAGHKDIETLDGRSDLYSLGVMAFRMLTGQFPFARNATAFEAIENHLKTPPRKVGSLGLKVPRELAAFVDRCLVKDREKRWKDASEAHEVLQRIVHPRMSPVKVSVPFALVGVVGLGALYLTRDPVEHNLTLVNPAIESVSERVVKALYLGPESSAKVLILESDAAWDPGAPLLLLDQNGGKELQGWSVRWSDAATKAIEIACLDGAKSAAALLEIEGGRRERWRSSDRIFLNHLGPWTIQGVTVAGHDPDKQLDPRQRALQLEVEGDPEGRAALASIEVLWEHLEDALIGGNLGKTTPASATGRGELSVYAGPALDALFTGTPYEAKLRVVARDRAGQEKETTTTLRIAGAPAALTPRTGFIVKPEGSADLLRYSGESQVLLPGNALRVATTAPARAKIYLELESATEPITRSVDPEDPLVLTLKELHITGDQDLPGTLRIEVDDSPWVDRIAPDPDKKPLAFLYTPKPPQIQAMLDWAERPLDTSISNPFNGGPSVKLVVSQPPGTPLWIEAACGSDTDGAPAPERMQGMGRGSFELPISLPNEGRYRIVVQKYALLANDKRGPEIPPEHVFPLEVDRTKPVVELQLEGSEGAASDGTPLFRGSFTQRIVASVTEDSELVWTLTTPAGPRTGKLEAGARELPPLDEYEKPEGRYELELVATDRAGNPGTKSAAWEVARTGPVLELQEPVVAGSDQRWTLKDGRRWNVRVSASDANSVAAVSVRVVYEDIPGPELALVHADGNVWELPESARPTAHPWWTGKKLALVLVARDGAGFETPATVSGIVPELAREGELVIAPRERPEETMVEFPVNGTYVFGGRNGLDGLRTWNVQIEGLRSFYLDASEVTRGEYLEFVRAEGGFADPRWWSASTRPNMARAEELERALIGEEEKPATGIAWAEARAYAAWRGKRLPTLVEWEFAVRGPNYQKQPAGAAVKGAADWPANLCTGAREWTATPENLVAKALDFPSQCRSYTAMLFATAAPPTSAGSAAAGAAVDAAAPLATAHWITAPGPGGTADWTAKDVCADEGNDDVGFRCALDQGIAHSCLDRGEYVPVE